MERISIDGIHYDVLSSSEIIDPGLANNPMLAKGFAKLGINEAMIVARPGSTSQYLVYRMAAGHLTAPIKIKEGRAS